MTEKQASGELISGGGRVAICTRITESSVLSDREAEVREVKSLPQGHRG